MGYPRKNGGHNMKTIKPGQSVPSSGQYVIVGPRGGISKTEVTLVKGNPAPPTPKPHSSFAMVDKTKHKND